MPRGRVSSTCRDFIKKQKILIAELPVVGKQKGSGPPKAPEMCDSVVLSGKRLRSKRERKYDMLRHRRAFPDWHWRKWAQSSQQRDERKLGETADAAAQPGTSAASRLLPRSQSAAGRKSSLDPGRLWVIPGLNRLLGNYRSKQLALRSGYCPVVF